MHLYPYTTIYIYINIQLLMNLKTETSDWIIYKFLHSNRMLSTVAEADLKDNKKAMNIFIKHVINIYRMAELEI